jgi:dolichyl-phosphate-mannose--protein O-mannosyl transferase
VALVYILGRRLFGRTIAALAGLLAATDFLLIVQSRVAMLDIFLSFFVVLGFLFVAVEHDRVRRLEERGGGKLVLRWRVAAGLALGAACAVKWSGVYALAAAGALMVVWSVRAALRIRRADNEAGVGPRAASPVAELNATLLGVGVPAVVAYLSSYAVWLYDHHFSVSAFVTQHKAMLAYHMHLTAHHTYASRAWTWPLIIRPVAYYYAGGTRHGTGTATHILAFGNPAVWWVALGAAAWFIYRVIRYRRASDTIVLVAWVAQYLPWVFFARPQFFFYMAPIVPFMLLAVAVSLYDLVTGAVAQAAGTVCFFLLVFGLATAIALWFYNPVGHPMLTQAGDRRIDGLVMVPILLVVLAGLIGRVRFGPLLRKVLTGGYLVFACGFSLYFFYPVLAAVTLPYPWWLGKMLFRTWI